LKTRYLAILIPLLLLPLLAAALPPPASDTPVELEADRLDFDQTSGRYHAQGNVRLIQGEFTLTGEQLWWNKLTGEVDASGQVHFTGPGEELTGQRMSYDFQKGTGVVEEGEASWPEKSLRLSGQRIEQLGTQAFRLYDGRITLCDGERPSWSVGSRQADVTVGRYLTAKHALIYIKDVPVFYLPYVMIPIKSERESGFLMPSLGFSSRRGTEVKTAWYQVMGRNMDATIFLDNLSKLGTGVGLEYRYIFTHGQAGTFKGYSVFAQDGVNRRAVDWKHFGQINEDLRLVADAEFVNERDYFSDYGDVVGEYNQQKVISSLFVNQRWDYASLTGQYKSIKDLESTETDPWKAAPQIDFSVAPLKLFATPVFFGLQSSYTRFEGDTGNLGARLSLRPNVAVHTSLGRALEFNFEYGYRQNQYFQVDATTTDVSGHSDMQALVSSRFSRVFNRPGSSWLHSIEPAVNYVYVESNLDAGLPEFDRYDQSDLQHSAGYGLVTRLTGKWSDDEGGEIQREVLWLKLSQDYALQKADDGTSSFSNLRTQLTLRPWANSSLGADVYYDVDQGSFPDLSLNGSLMDGRGNGVRADYHKRQAETGLEQVENINLGFDIALMKPVYLGYEQRYDLLQSSSLEQVLTLDLRQQCWGLKATLRDRDADRSIMLELNLSGIGQVGKFGRSFSSQ